MSVNQRLLQLDDDRDPWEIQTGEDPNHFYWFAVFRDMGASRKMIDVAAIKEEGEREPGVVYTDADVKRRRHYTAARLFMYQKPDRWKERLLAYDQYMDRVRVDQAVQRQRAAVDLAVQMHDQVCRGILSVSTRKLKRMIELSESNPRTLDEIAHDDLMAYAKLGITLHRVVLGIDQPDGQPPQPAAAQQAGLTFEQARAAAAAALAAAAKAEKDDEAAAAAVTPPPPETEPGGGDGGVAGAD